MNELIKIALFALIESKGVQHSKAAVGRWSAAALFAVASAVAGVGLLGCVITAVWIYAAPYVGNGGAALVVAAIILTAWLVAFAVFRRPAAAVASPQSGEARALLDEFLTLCDQNKGTVLMAALTAGLVAGGTARSSSEKR